MPNANRKPSKLLFCSLIFLGVYPLVTGLSYALQPITPDWQIWQRSLILVSVMVPSMVFVLIPVIQTALIRAARRG